MRYKEDNDNRYRVNFMRATEELMDALTVESFISYLEENAEFEDNTVEYIDGKCVKCRAYDLTEENSKLHKEFLVTEDGRVFYWRTLLDKIELVDDEIPEGMVEGLQEGDTYRHFNAIWVVDKIYTVDDPTLWYKLRIKSHVIKKSPMYKGIGTMDCAYSRGALRLPDRREICLQFILRVLEAQRNTLQNLKQRRRLRAFVESMAGSG